MWSFSLIWDGEEAQTEPWGFTSSCTPTNIRTVEPGLAVVMKSVQNQICMVNSWQEQSGHFICKLFITENIKSVKYTSLWLGHKLSDYQIFFMRLCDTDLTWQHQGLWKQCAAVLSQISSSSRSAKRNKSTCEFTTTLSSDTFAAPAFLSAVLLCLIYLYSCSIHSVPVVYTDSWRPAGWVVVPVILLWSHLECLCSWCTGV